MILSLTFSFEVKQSTDRHRSVGSFILSLSILVNGTRVLP